MSNPLTPEQQELIAGYVLGDLEPEELAQFQILLRDQPRIEAEVLSLQTALGAIPFGLEAAEPPGALRSQIIAAALPPRLEVKRRKRRIPWGPMVVSMLTGLVLVLGVQNWHYRQQLAQQPDKIAITAEEIVPRNQNSFWNSFEEVLADHRHSLIRSQGPVDLATSNIAEIRSVYSGRIKLSEELPHLKKVKLLGGSFCELKNTKGIRLSYQVPTGQTVSFYQLLRSEGFPKANEVGPLVQVAAGPNVFIWGNQKYIYLLVGDLPVPEMKKIAPVLQAI
ncbi:MAG: hypothetical protein ACFCU8_13965 [Thermosynechococcaceae cyanobacterium]